MSEQSDATTVFNEQLPSANYMERRKRALDSLLAVEPISSLLPVELQIASRHYFETRGYRAEEVHDLPSGKTISIACADNGIMILQSLKKSEVSIEHAPQPVKPFLTRLRAFMDYQPQPFSIYDIENYYVLDRESQTGCDLSRIWSSETTGYQKPRAIKVPLFMNPAFAPTKEGPVLILSNIIEEVNPHTLEGIPENKRPILNLFSHLHEIGHFLQEPNKKSRNTLEWELGTNAYNYQMNKLAISLWALMRQKSSKNPSTPREDRTLGTLAKTSKKGPQEREAHNFAILAIRKFREKRLDIFRNVDSETVRRFTTNALHD